MPTDEELARLARQTPALKSRPAVQQAVFNDPGLIERPSPTTTAAEDDRPLADKFPALKRLPAYQQPATEAAHEAQREWDDARRIQF